MTPIERTLSDLRTQLTKRANECAIIRRQIRELEAEVKANAPAPVATFDVHPLTGTAPFP